ncbi:MAG: acyl-CoA desaturase [Planctomycetes bacterium]|nr:acyl-CoA desaturase [Planctomycetota bacterium]
MHGACIRVPPSCEPTASPQRPETRVTELATAEAVPSSAAGDRAVRWRRVWPFVLMHAACGLVFVVGWSPVAVGTAVALYLLRMFGITAFYHRCFSHRAFRAGRVVQFLGALLGASAVQRGPLWWAAHHRNHHRHADTERDAHSPHAHGILWAHFGWFASGQHVATDLAAVRDLAAFPELRWLDRHDRVVPVALLVALLGLGAWLEHAAPELGTNALQMAVWGFCVSTIVLFHVTSSVNSLGHLLGRRAWPTRDQSRNSFVLALLTLGEGWHNNHHWSPGAARQGFRWWEIDLCYYGLRVMAALGLVDDLRPLPSRARTGERRLRP